MFKTVGSMHCVTKVSEYICWFKSFFSTTFAFARVKICYFSVHWFLSSINGIKVNGFTPSHCRSPRCTGALSKCAKVWHFLGVSHVQIALNSCPPPHHLVSWCCPEPPTLSRFVGHLAIGCVRHGSFGWKRVFRLGPNPLPSSRENNLNVLWLGDIICWVCVSSSFNH